MIEELMRDKAEEVKSLGALKNVAIWLHRTEYGDSAGEEWTIFADGNGRRMYACDKYWDAAIEKLRRQFPCDAATEEVLLSL